jgi:CheY-like chemotaxis protein
MPEAPSSRVLLVEDEALVALMIEEMLVELGFNVVASAGQLKRACELATNAVFDLALLDVNLGGEMVFPVARILRIRSIPFLFSTGYGVPSLADEFSEVPAIGKPFSLDQLSQKLQVLLQSEVPIQVR